MIHPDDFQPYVIQSGDLKMIIPVLMDEPLRIGADVRQSSQQASRYRVTFFSEIVDPDQEDQVAKVPWAQFRLEMN